MRVLRFAVILCCVFALLLPDMADAARGRAQRVNPRTGVNDPRYAALVMNPRTGEIYHQQNADARRYPASLTKMMTLYLLFEALENKKISLNDRMKVSDYASVQPQTNISLTTRDQIPVETAIKALVVRSANDVAVVVGERLGGSVPNFAKMMTAKARALGMNNTVFQNPHGLPNGNQVTTARDMAKLGIALKRDFPQYYQYFSTRQFSWKGVTYYTHNRVMLRYSGTDGIKTGFINASGFNVVSSTTRGGRPLIGVVMGGGSGQWRDDRMIALFNSAYATIAKRGNARSGVVIAKNLPSVNGKQVATPAPAPAPRVVSSVQVAPARPPAASAAKPVAVVQAPTPAPIVAAPPAATVAAAAAPSPVVIAPPPAAPARPPVSTAQPQTLNQQMAALQARGQVQADAGVAGMWGIQVGAFSSRELAERAALQAYQLAQNSLQGSRIAVLGTGSANAMVHRARLENISEQQAKKACETLISNNSPCFIFRAGL